MKQEALYRRLSAGICRIKNSAEASIVFSHKLCEFIYNINIIENVMIYMFFEITRDGKFCTCSSIGKTVDL